MFGHPHHPHHPPSAEARHPVRSWAVLMALLSLTASAGCDDAVIGQQLPGFDLANAAGSVEAAETAATDRGDLGDLGDLAELSDAPLDPQGPSEPVDPQGDPHPCVEAAFEIGRVCVEETQAIAEACLETIAELFQNGHPEAAHAAARECMEQIGGHTEQCLHGLGMHRRQCVEELIEQEAPLQLIRAVIRAHREAGEQIMAARRQAVCGIEHAVDVGSAHSCAAAVQRIAGGAAEHNGQVATECVALIEELLANGQVEEAFEAAGHCIRQIRLGSIERARTIQEIARNCLRRLGRPCCANPELVQLVREAREASLQLVFNSAQGAVHQIREALPD